MLQRWEKMVSRFSSDEDLVLITVGVWMRACPSWSLLLSYSYFPPPVVCSSQTDVMHQSVYELVHTEDQQELRRNLHWALNPPAAVAAITQDSPQGDHSCRRLTPRAGQRRSAGTKCGQNPICGAKTTESVKNDIRTGSDLQPRRFKMFVAVSIEVWR